MKEEFLGDLVNSLWYDGEKLNSDYMTNEEEGILVDSQFHLENIYADIGHGIKTFKEYEDTINKIIKELLSILKI